MWDTIIITPFVNVLMFIYHYIGQNFGIAILLFTLLSRIITHPLTIQQLKGTSAMTNMQKDKRWIEAQAKHKGDKEKLSQIQMALYKEYGVNPLSSCLPLLISFPIMIGLYQSVIIAMADSPLDLLNLTRHIYSGFLNISSLIPINKEFLWFDLGQPEKLVLPFLPFGIPVLTIFVVATTYMQSKLMQPPAGSGNDQSAMMASSMNMIMPFFMGYITLTLASGLALYLVASNVLAVGQYALLGKVNWRNLLPKKKDEPGVVISQRKPEPEKMQTVQKLEAENSQSQRKSSLGESNSKSKSSKTLSKTQYGKNKRKKN